MNKLSCDEFMLIIMKLKMDYEKKIDDLTNKCDAFKKICWKENNFDMTGYYKCNSCNQSIYDGIYYYYELDEQESEVEILSDDYIACSTCKKKYCHACDNEYITVYRNNPLPNLFYCTECYNNK